MSDEPDLTAIASQLARVPDPAALLAGLFAVAPVAFQLYEASGRSLLVNPAFRALFGSEPPPDYNVLDDDIAAKTGVLGQIHRAFAGETVRVPTTWYDPRRLERVKVTTGRRVAIESTFLPLRDAAGEVTHVGVVFADRTELETERDLLRAIVDQSDEGIIVADADGAIRVFNQAAEQQHGVGAVGVAAERWADTFGLYALDGQKLSLDDTPLHRALQGQTQQAARWRVRRPDGETRTLAGSAVPLRHGDGSVAGALVVTRDETDRLATEDALRRSEERYRGIVAALAEGITIQDRDGVLIEANASAERLLGLRRDEMTGRTSSSAEWRAVDEQGAPLPGELHPPMVALRTGEAVHDVIMGIERPGGERMWLSVNAQPLFRPGTREPMGVVSSFFDVTTRRHAADERARLLARAKAGEERFRTLADSIPQLAWFAEPDGHIPWYNRRWHEYTGQPLEAQEGWQWTSVHDPADLPRVVAKWKASLASGEPFDDQFRLRRHDGALRWFLTRVEPLRDEAGSIVRWFGTNVDIDDHKRSEQSLRILAEAGIVLAASVELPTTLQNVTRLVVPALGRWAVVVLRDDDGGARLAAASHVDAESEARLRRAFAEPDSTELGAPLRRALDAGQSAIWRSPELADVTRTTERAPPGDLGSVAALVVPLAASGRTFGALAIAAPEASAGADYDADDLRLVEELGRRVAVAIDAARLLEITLRERERAEEANRAKDDFLSIASHELRTPLNAILGWSRMLRAGVVRAEKHQHALEVIERNANAQVQLVEDILDVSRIISGKLRLDVGPVNLARVVADSVDVMRAAADAKGVEVRVLRVGDGPTVVGDAGRLQQIVWNLLANAVKFTPRGGRVEIDARLALDAHAEILVADTGQGIAPGFLPFVFEPFRQADASSTRAHGGLGLGLAIVKHLVELHGGRIAVLSDGPGAGATFIVRVPAAPAQAYGQAAAPRGDVERRGLRPNCPPELGGARVLVVDDEPDARELLEAILGPCGAEVRTVASASEALAAIQAEAPDAVVSDLGMPGEDGYALVRAVRALAAERGGRVPMVAITAYARATDRTRALAEGFTHHMTKPVEPAKFLALMSSIVGAKKPR